MTTARPRCLRALVDTRLVTDPRWLVLAGGQRALRNELQAAYFRLACVAAVNDCGGHLTAAQVRDGCDDRRRTLELLCTPILGDPPFLHGPGDECPDSACQHVDARTAVGWSYRLCTASPGTRVVAR